jgi:leucyl-tRNA synthetase
MSKSRGNVVNPDEIIEKFGADSLRMYEMFMGPLEDSKPWSEKGIIGNWRFLNRIWIYYQKQFSKPLKYKSADISEFERLFHQTLKKVTEDIETLHFNTAISSLMILFKEIETTPSIPKKYASDFIAMLSVFAPFISEEIWRGVMGNKKSILTSAWPEVDKRKTMQELITIAVQINGRTRGTISAKKGISKEKVLESILANLKLGNYIKDVEIKRVIFVPDKIINILL